MSYVISAIATSQVVRNIMAVFTLKTSFPSKTSYSMMTSNLSYCEFGSRRVVDELLLVKVDE